mgnify:CR=1 FL=1
MEVLSFANDEIVVNVQGDEPMLSPVVIDQVAKNLDESKMDMATLCEQIETDTSALIQIASKLYIICAAKRCTSQDRQFLRFETRKN